MSADDEARHALILRWLADAGHDHLVLACAEAELPGALVLPCCLADVPLAWVAELATLASVHAAVGACARPGASTLHLRELADLTSRVLVDGMATPGQTIRYRSPPTRRRGLLGLGHPGPGSPVVGHPERLAAAVAMLPVRGDAASHASRLAVSDACTACGTCVRGCPEHALLLDLAEGTATLSQRLDFCQSDLACVASCPEGAITGDGQRTWSDVTARPTIALIELEVTTCRNCRAPVPITDGQPLCRVCRVKVKDPFGVHLPPAAQAIRERRRAQPD